MLWSPQELKAVFDFIRKNGPATALMGQNLDLTKGQIDGIRRRNPEDWASAVEDYNKKNPKIAPEVNNRAMQDALKLKTQNRALSAQLESAVKEATLIEELERIVKQSVLPLPCPTDLPKKVKISDKDLALETMVLNIGDIHGGEIVKPERVKYLNEYNSLICQQRFGHYIHQHLKIKDKMEAGGGWYFENLVVNLLGDMVSGTIHEIERHSDHTIIKTCMGIASMIAEGIAHLARHYPEIHIMGVVGNHGRLPDQRKKAYKDPERNWDYLIYLAVAQYLRDVPNVKCFFPSSYSIQLQIRGWRFQLSHGDDIKSWGGLPAYGLDRSARNQNAAEAMRGEHIDYFIHGHFHQKIEIDVGGADLIVNGDFKGTDEWILGALGKAGCPRQTFFAVHEEHGITHKWDIKLDKGAAPDAPLFSITPWDVVENDERGQPISIYEVN